MKFPEGNWPLIFKGFSISFRGCMGKQMCVLRWTFGFTKKKHSSDNGFRRIFSSGYSVGSIYISFVTKNSNVDSQVILLELSLWVWIISVSRKNLEHSFAAPFKCPKNTHPTLLAIQVVALCQIFQRNHYQQQMLRMTSLVDLRGPGRGIDPAFQIWLVFFDDGL